jgi:hypothetical protein
MGFCDYLTCEVEVPGLGVPAGIRFQTKDLFCMSTELTITSAGRLVEHCARYEMCGTREVRPGVSFPKFRKIPLGERDLEFHGDVSFCGDSKDGTFVEYVARFTNGQMEWLRPKSELPDYHRALLESRY